MDGQDSATVEQDATFDWEGLPLELAHLILDALDWPAHWVGRRVCRAWRSYLDKSKLTAKRYYTPRAERPVTHKFRNPDGSIETRQVAPPPLLREYRVHRILGQSALGFFLAIGDITPEQKNWLEGYYFSHSNVLAPYEEDDFREYLPGAHGGKLLQREYTGGLDFEGDDLGDGDIDEYAMTETGPYCLRLQNIPFGNEPVMEPFTTSWRVIVYSKVVEGLEVLENTITGILLGRAPLSINGLVEVIKDCCIVVCKHLIRTNYCALTPDIMGDIVFVRICDVSNMSTTWNSKDLLLEISIEDHCQWVRDSEEKKTQPTDHPVGENA
ncbi:hypothetical protein ABW19_dt0209708 [Dactylella cylindrospora]|nr:hypothetical protein ABW19_dt0209708 [Dactylella cylindrospora]